MTNVFAQKIQYNQKVQECQSLRVELSRFVTNPTTPAVSTASSAASAHAGLSSASRSSASPPNSRVASPTSSPSYFPNIASPLSRLGHSRSTSVNPTRSASVAPISPTRSASIAPTRISTPGFPSTAHRSATPGPTSTYRSTTPASPSPIRKSRTMSMSQQHPPPLPSSDRWPVSLIAEASDRKSHV